jgi:hypothetical protein
VERHWYYVGIAFFGMVNGMFSPLTLFSFIFSSHFMAAPLFGSAGLVFYFSSLMLSTATVILGGIPAALYERHIGAKHDSTETSLFIWLACTGILTIPAVGTFLKVGL